MAYELVLMLVLMMVIDDDKINIDSEWQYFFLLESDKYVVLYFACGTWKHAFILFIVETVSRIRFLASVENVVVVSVVACVVSIWLECTSNAVVLKVKILIQLLRIKRICCNCGDGICIFLIIIYPITIFLFHLTANRTW